MIFFVILIMSVITAGEKIDRILSYISNMQQRDPFEHSSFFEVYLPLTPDDLEGDPRDCYYEIHVRSDGFINASRAAKIVNKIIDDWLETRECARCFETCNAVRKQFGKRALTSYWDAGNENESNEDLFLYTMQKFVDNKSIRYIFINYCAAKEFLTWCHPEIGRQYELWFQLNIS